MLITVFRKTEQGWQEIQTYHKFRVETIEEMKERLGDDYVSQPKTACPGCGKVLARAEINDTHLCDGTLTDQPLTVQRGKLRAAARLIRGTKPKRPRGRPRKDSIEQKKSPQLVGDQTELLEIITSCVAK